MRKAAIARRYASALMGIGKVDSSYATYGSELANLIVVFVAEPALYKILLNPMHKLETRLELLGKVCEAAGVTETVKRFMEILVEKRSVRLLPDIDAAYSKMQDELSGRLRVEVQAPAVLTDAILDSIKAKLASETKKEVVVSFVVKPELIGGMVVKIGNRILDGSVKTQLDKAKEKLMEGAF
ncbi:MAG: ATP synthase F1 subunit delta [Thermodesulfobacteriota bacterium]